MENSFASPLTSPGAFTRGNKSGSYMSLNEPLGKHAADNISLLSHHSRNPHTKHFDHNQARKHLFRAGGFKLLVTVLFSALMCLALKAWEGFRGPVVLSKIDVRIFNSLMIGISLCLGLNLLVLVAVSSLFYPVDTSECPLLTRGNVTVASLVTWAPYNETTGNATALEAAWMFGMEALVYPEFTPNDIQSDLSGLAGTPLYKTESGAYEYRFFNRHPLHQYSNYLLSNRSVASITECSKVEIRGNGTFLEDTDGFQYVEARFPSRDWENYYPPERGPGMLSWSASVGSFCGSRCTNFTILQERTYGVESHIVNETSIFVCNSTVSEVRPSNNKHDITVATKADSDAVWGTDEFARVAAGAMGWTGTAVNQWDDRQTRSYTSGSRWSPLHVVNAEEVEDMLARFTIGAIAAFDDHGIRHNVTNQHVVPSPGQQLNVDWSYLLSILGGICALQLAALCCLLGFANRTIVRDESYFSLAMLLSPVIERIGKEGGGMNMSGSEIKNHPKLQFKKIQYSYREGKNGDPHQVDILWEGRDSRDNRKSWVAGIYN